MLTLGTEENLLVGGFEQRLVEHFVGGLHCLGPLNDDVCSWMSKDDITAQDVTGGVKQRGRGGCNVREAQKRKMRNGRDMGGKCVGFAAILCK